MFEYKTLHIFKKTAEGPDDDISIREDLLFLLLVRYSGVGQSDAINLKHSHAGVGGYFAKTQAPLWFSFSLQDGPSWFSLEFLRNLCLLSTKRQQKIHLFKKDLLWSSFLTPDCAACYFDKCPEVETTWWCFLCYVKSLQSCLTLCNPTDCSPPDSSVHGILQAILLWTAIPFSRGSSQPWDRIHVSCLLNWQAGYH